MNPPDLQFWGRVIGVLALEVAVLVGGILLIGRWARRWLANSICVSARPGCMDWNWLRRSGPI